MHKAIVENLKIVPEEIIIHCAKHFGPDEPNNFKDSIDKAYQFRKAGLTPMYLCSDTFQEIMVTSKECLTRQYN